MKAYVRVEGQVVLFVSEALMEDGNLVDVR